MPKILRELTGGLLHLFYPNVCACCSGSLLHGEQYICSHCLYNLPVTGFYKERNNPVERLFWGRVMVEQAMAGYYFKKGNSVQHLIHQLKYKGRKEIGERMGNEMGQTMRSSVFEAVDTVVPVPLHPQKLRKRGYNQSEWIARGVCAAIDKPMDTVSLVRRVFTNTQTRKHHYERWENVAAGFGLTSPTAFSGKHILLIDDVVTTGATLEACAHTVQSAPDVRVSIAALATAMD